MWMPLIPCCWPVMWPWPLTFGFETAPSVSLVTVSANIELFTTSRFYRVSCYASAVLGVVIVSVTHVLCDKTKQCTTNILIPHCSFLTSTVAGGRRPFRRPWAFQRTIDAVRTLPRSPSKGDSKSIFLFLNKSQFQPNKVCYKVSLCENVQRQSCSITIPPSKNPDTLAPNVSVQPKS